MDGGTDWIENIQPLCKPCNTRKGTRTIDYRPGREV
jgi:5-methylcytosine-specific restriction endonuclease McrA